MMYATRGSKWGPPSFGPMQRSSITRRLAGTLTLIVLLACTHLPAHIRGDVADVSSWQEAPEYLDLLVPAAHRSAYRAYTSPLGIEGTLEQLFRDPGVLRPPGAWTIQARTPYDAFGLSGSYNRWKVAGLYRSRRAYVSRGPRMNGGQMESWTLIAPYPDVHLQRLDPGTLILVLHIPSNEEP
jgi:hypothetical protein